MSDCVLTKEVRKGVRNHYGLHSKRFLTPFLPKTLSLAVVMTALPALAQDVPAPKQGK